MAVALQKPRHSRETVFVPHQRPVVVVGLLILSDLLTLAITGLAAYWARRQFGPLETDLYLRFLPSLLLFPLGGLYAGLYPGYALSPAEQLRSTFRAITWVTLILVAASFLLKVGDKLSRPVILGWWLLSVFVLPLSRSLVRAALIRTSLWGHPVVVLGAAKTGEAVVRRLLSNPGLGLRPVACYDDDSTKHGQSCGGAPVVGTLRQAATVAQSGKVSYVIIAMPGLSRERLTYVVEQYAAVFSHVIIIPDLLGLTSLWVSARDIQGVLGLELQQNLLSAWNHLLKRTLDLVIAIPALFMVGPLILILGWLVKLNSPGPGFYAQDREGLNGDRIRVWKLRTMVPDAETKLNAYLDANPNARCEWDKHMKLKDDPRIVPRVGHLLRRYSLDELPQIWNIIKGEMSLVGPRPFPYYHLDRFSPAFRALRRKVLPGLTGLWQVSARSEGDLGIQQELDTYYIRNWSLWLDIYLLGRTVTAVLCGEGAY